MSKSWPAGYSIGEVATDAMTTQYFYDEETPPPFVGKEYRGETEDFVVIVGDNASGKSLLFRLIAGFAQKDYGTTPVTISIRERTGGGTMEMGRMRQTMMFGDEETNSTGAASVRVLKAAYHNGNNYANAVVMLDEPELGLSDAYAHPLGLLIAQKHQERSATNHGTVVVTHSRAVVAGILEGLGQKPRFVFLGEEPVDIETWIATPTKRTLDELMALSDVALERFRAVHRLSEERKKEKAR